MKSQPVYMISFNLGTCKFQVDSLTQHKNAIIKNFVREFDKHEDAETFVDEMNAARRTVR